MFSSQTTSSLKFSFQFWRGLCDTSSTSFIFILNNLTIQNGIIPVFDSFFHYNFPWYVRKMYYRRRITIWSVLNISNSVPLPIFNLILMEHTIFCHRDEVYIPEYVQNSNNLPNDLRIIEHSSYINFNPKTFCETKPNQW